MAERIVEPAPDTVLVPLPALGHSALDPTSSPPCTSPTPSSRARTGGSPPSPAHRALPRRGASRYLGPAIAAGLAVDRWTPDPRRVVAHR